MGISPTVPAARHHGTALMANWVSSAVIRAAEGGDRTGSASCIHLPHEHVLSWSEARVTAATRGGNGRRYTGMVSEGACEQNGRGERWESSQRGRGEAQG